jgi:tetratricopeptide (TPR) repeat protein
MIALVLTFALLAGQPAADAWREHPEFVRGARAFEAQRWDEAARAFEAAYADHPRPELLWAHAQSLRLSGRCDEALPLYDRFLGTNPSADEIVDAHTNIADCRARVGEAAEVEPVALPPAPSPSSMGRAPTPPPTPTVQRREIVDDVRPLPRRHTRQVPSARKDPWGHALLWSGVAVAGVGTGLLAAGHVRREQAADSRTEYEYQARFSGAPALGNAGIAVLASSAALVTAGIVRFAVVGARARRDSRNPARSSVAARGR